MHSWWDPCPSNVVDFRLSFLFLALACTPADTGAGNEASLAQKAQDSVVSAVVSPDGGTVELAGLPR